MTFCLNSENDWHMLSANNPLNIVRQQFVNNDSSDKSVVEKCSKKIQKAIDI